MTDEIVSMLNQFANLKAALDVHRLEKEDLIAQILTPEIKAQIADIEAEFSEKTAAANKNLAELEAAIKAAVTAHGETVSAEHYQAVYSKGRTSWDTKALDGFCVAHPEVAQFKTTGAPSVSIRAR